MNKLLLQATALSTFILLGTAGQTLAIPSLQLDITDGTYINDTTFATTNSFTIYAFLIPDNNAPLTDTYYISAAIPGLNMDDGNGLGSFMIDGREYYFADLTFGAPPFGDPAGNGRDNGDLQQHNIFETYYAEVPGFTFSDTWNGGAYNVEDGIQQPGTTMYYKAFTVDVSNLNPDFVVHFDLYSTLLTSAIRKGKTSYGLNVDQFAPFSHDAESGHPNNPVPEPATMLLLGCSLAGLAGLQRRRLRKEKN